MSQKVVNPSELPAVNPTYSQAIIANGFIFVAGQIGIDPATGKVVSDDIAEQTRQILDNIVNGSQGSPLNAGQGGFYKPFFNRI